MRWWTLGVAASVLGCGGGDAPPAVEPGPYAAASVPVVEVRATVESIELQNINKAKDHYTYNVNVRVRHDGIPEASFESLHGAGVLSVRVAKIYWGRLDEAERGRIAPDGPQHWITLDAWETYRVGEVVDLRLAPMSADLSLLAPPAWQVRAEAGG